MMKISSLLFLILCFGFQGNISLASPLANSCQELLLNESLVEKYQRLNTKIQKYRNDSAPYAEKVDRFQKLIKGFLFFDFKHLAKDILSLHLGETSPTKALEKISRTYDQEVNISHILGTDLKQIFRSILSGVWGNYGQQRPFSNFLKTYEKTKTDFLGAITIQNLNETHRFLMANGIEEITEDALGKMRDVSVYGNQRYHALSKDEITEIDANPYTQFSPTAIPSENPVQAFGDIVYPTVRRMKPTILAILDKVDPVLAKEIREISGLSRTDISAANTKVLEEKMIRALTEERITFYRNKFISLLPLDSDDKVMEYIKNTARFQRDLVSIHPYLNGNGRTTRYFCLYLPLMLANLPPPRLLDPNQDLTTSLSEWEGSVLTGVKNMLSLYEQFVAGIELENPFLNMPSMVDPLFPPENTRKSQSAYQEFLSHHLKYQGILRNDFLRNPISVIREIHHRFFRVKLGVAQDRLEP